MKKAFKYILMMSLLATSSLSYGTVYFQNTGTVSGWSSPNVNPVPGDNKGTVSQVSSPTYKTGTALKATQTYDPAYSQRTGYTGGYHAEVVKFGAAAVGQDRYFGQVIMLPSNWAFHNSGFDCFEQISPENPSGAWSLTGIQGTTIRIGSGPVAANLGTISKGVWTRIILRYKFGNPGTFECWIDGVKTYSKSNIDVSKNGSNTYRCSNGIYCTAWRNHKPSDPDAGDLFNQLTRTIYHDQFRITSSAAEADPIHW